MSTNEVKQRTFDVVLSGLFLTAAVIAITGTIGMFKGNIGQHLPIAIPVLLYALSLATLVVVPGVWLMFRKRSSPLHMAP